MRPKVLLATTCKWFAFVRLALALKNSGFQVEVVCPAGHPVGKVKEKLPTYPYSALFASSSIQGAIQAAKPELVIPADDLATVHLHAIYRDALQQGTSGSSIARVLERSLGAPASYSIVPFRSKLLSVAEQAGVRVPKTDIVADEAGLSAWIAANGLPAVLKTDGTSGGVGVELVYTGDEARRAFATLNVPPKVLRVAKRALVDGDMRLLPPYLRRERPLVNVQSMILGRDATSAVACWQGKVLASISFDVLHTWQPKGPASVLRLLVNQEMDDAAKTIAQTLGLSGLYGFDFMIEERTDKAFLIEMNPRATQTCHLPLGPSRDLPAALWAAISGEPLQETKSITDKTVIALFPQEWQRNPQSHFLLSAYHDVPWDEPDLIRACILSGPRRSFWSTGQLAQTYVKLP